MKDNVKLILLCAATVAVSACSKSRVEQMQLAEKVRIECTPEVLALVGDRIPVDLTLTYPDGYFHPKTTLDVTPVLVYGGKEQAGPVFTYQGEKVMDNYKVVPNHGGTVREHFEFKFEEGVEQAYLELRGVARFNGKSIAVPAVKVADGTILTQLMADPHGSYSYKRDDYQAVIHRQTEGQVIYDYNSAAIKGSELRSSSIKELQASLAEIAANPRYTVKGSSVVAYASPEGGETYNAELSDRRADAARKAWSSVTGEKAPDDLEIRSVGQDWEGFKEAIEKSDIEDKELILRVLSMYSDPAVRESEIKNLSRVYTEISKNVFPELRRARFITEVDFRNFTDEELVELSRQTAGLLDEEGLLRVASLADNPVRKAELYRQAADKFDSDRARFNLAALALDEERPDDAARELDAVKTQDPDVLNARGVVELQRGDREAAAAWFRKAGTPEAEANLGLLDLLAGDYDAAADRLKGTAGRNSAVAGILAVRLGEAEAAVTGDAAQDDYLRAIIAARKGDAAGVKANLESVSRKDERLYEQSRRDIEFAKFR